jgi:hypothetical protein
MGLGIDMGPRAIGRLLRNPSGIAEMLTMEHPDTGDSPAEIMADLVNLMRADTKKLAEIHGVDVEIRLMTPERAAEVLAGTIDGEGVELLVMFNELAEQRDRVLREALDEEEYETFDQQRQAIMHTAPADVE